MRALITGATDGVGRLVAKRLAAAGTGVIVHGRNHDKGRGVVEEIQRETGGYERLTVNVRRHASVTKSSTVHRLATTARASGKKWPHEAGNAFLTERLASASVTR